MKKGKEGRNRKKWREGKGKLCTYISFHKSAPMVVGVTVTLVCKPIVKLIVQLLERMCVLSVTARNTSV